MILRITQNVRDKIKVKAPASEPALPPQLFLSEWYVNLITIDRKSYFLFCEATTLYSVVKSSNRINDSVVFERLATDVLFEQFKFNGTLDIKIFEKLADSMTLLKTNNRRITASMNQKAFELQWSSEDGDQGFDDVNDLITGYLNYDSPREAFEKAAATINPSAY